MSDEPEAKVDDAEFVEVGAPETQETPPADEDHPNLIEEPPEEDDDPSPGAAPGDAIAAADAAPAAEELSGGEPPEEIDPYLLDRARVHGMTIDEAEALGSAGLSQTLRVLDRSQAQAAEAEPPKPTPEETQRAEDDARFAAKYELKYPEKDQDGNDIEYNRHARQALAEMNDHYHELNQRQQRALDGVLDRQDAVEERANRQYSLQMQSQFDTEVGSLGKDYEQLLGKGTESELDENSVGYRNRGKLLREMGVIDGVRKANGLSPQSMKATLNQALGSVFKVQAKTKAVREVKGKVKKAAKGMSVPPTSRETAGPVLSDDEKVNEIIRQRMIDKGLDPGPQHVDEFSG